MNKPWMGYRGAALLMAAGLLQFVDGKIWLGILLVVLSIVSIGIKIYISNLMTQPGETEGYSAVERHGKKA